MPCIQTSSSKAPTSIPPQANQPAPGPRRPTKCAFPFRQTHRSHASHPQTSEGDQLRVPSSSQTSHRAPPMALTPRGHVLWEAPRDRAHLHFPATHPRAAQSPTLYSALTCPRGQCGTTRGDRHTVHPLLTARGQRSPNRAGATRTANGPPPYTGATSPAHHQPIQTRPPSISTATNVPRSTTPDGLSWRRVTTQASRSTPPSPAGTPHRGPGAPGQSRAPRTL